MKNTIYHLFYILYIWLIFQEIKGTYGEEYKIKNDKSSNNLLKLINNSNSQNNNEPLELKFEDSVYDIEKFDSSTKLLIDVCRNITFTGRDNGTVFRIKEKKNTYFHLRKSISNEKYSFIKFENIIFENYEKSEFYHLFYSEIQEHQYQLIINNCSFKNLNNVIYITYEYDDPLYKEHLIVNDSVFHDNTKILEIRDDSGNDISHYGISINNSTLEGTKDLMTIQNANITIENSKFLLNENEGIKDVHQESGLSVFAKLYGMGTLILKNCSFMDINVTNKLPFFYLEDSSSLEIENTIFSNCTTNYEYLININELQTYNNVILKNSIFENIGTLLNGNYVNCNISGSIFKNITSKKYSPVISDLKYSNISVTDTTFEDLNISSVLFHKDSSYVFSNIGLINIYTNFNAVFYFFYKSASLRHVTVKNVRCGGDLSDSSLILYESSGNENLLEIDQLFVSHTLSHGSFIMFKGSSNRFILKNSEINSSSFYGPFYKKKSEMLNIEIKNTTFSDNLNYNKLSNGLIHINSNDEITITSSKFEGNQSKRRGGAIYIDDIYNVKISFIFNLFSKNKAINGGVLYIKDAINENEPLSVTTDNSWIYFENNLFENNIAENFGGAIYMDLRKEHVFEWKGQNVISTNEAGMTGGGIYFSKCPNDLVQSMKENLVMKNNLVNRQVNDFIYKPFFVKLEEYSKAPIYSGEYFPLKFGVYDQFGNKIIDGAQYYSQIHLEISLTNVSNNPISDKTKLKNNSIIYTLINNNVNFLNDGFNFSKFRILSYPNDYILNFKLNNNEGEEIKLDISEVVKVKVKDCDKKHVKLYDKYGIMYCEELKCRSDCLIGKRAECLPGNITSSEGLKRYKNYPSKNQCRCLKGYQGKRCLDKVYIDFSDN